LTPNTEALVNLSKSYKWNVVWNSLYYNFISVNQSFLSHNYATAKFVSDWNKKSKQEQREIKKISTEFLKLYEKELYEKEKKLKAKLKKPLAL
jgi:deoxyribodipyrimidine photolyase-like uncharacterized protein